MVSPPVVASIPFDAVRNTNKLATLLTSPDHVPCNLWQTLFVANYIIVTRY